MSFVNVPPAPGSTGQNIESFVVTSSQHRQVFVMGAAGSTAVSPVTSSAGLLASLSSGTVTLSSNPTVTATAATNPWSSAPSFNVPMVSASSGLMQISGAVGLSSGTVTLSSVHTVTATAATNPWSCVPSFNIPMVSASSGLVQISGGLSSGVVTLSSVHTVTATAATNPWSSAPGFNVPIVSNSSGVVQAIGSTNRTYLAFTFGASSSASYTAISTIARVLYGWNVWSQTAAQAMIRLYNSTGATIGSTSDLILAIPIPGSTGLGAGNNYTLPEGTNFSAVMTLLVVDSFITTSTALSHDAGTIGGNFYYL